MRALNIGASGMAAQQMNVETISNNIANMTTTGFKRQRIEFADLMYQNIVIPGSASSEQGNLNPVGIQLGSGVKPIGIYRTMVQGTLKQTDSKLDLAVDGKGLFPISLPNGDTGYTRGGSFQLDATGQIVTAQGYVLQPGITIPNNASDIAINDAGGVSVTLSGQVAPQNIGQIQLANFPNEAGLEAIGDNLYKESAASGAALQGNPGTENFGKLRQGNLETSNVDAVSEITNMITAQRAYEMNSKAMKTADEMLSTVNNIK